MRLHIKTELSSTCYTLKTLGSMSLRTISLLSFPNPSENQVSNTVDRAPKISLCARNLSPLMEKVTSHKSSWSNSIPRSVPISDSGIWIAFNVEESDITRTPTVQLIFKQSSLMKVDVSRSFRLKNRLYPLTQTEKPLHHIHHYFIKQH